MSKVFEKLESAATRPLSGHRFARNLDWNLLRTFRDIAEMGGISNAARHLNRGQPAISMALRRLEELTQTKLCRRGPGGFELTSDGQLLAEVCERLFSTISNLPGSLDDAAQEVRGRVRVQLISNLVDDSIDKAMSSFHKDYPGVEIFVSVTTWDVIQRSLIRHEIEIGIAPVTFRLPDLHYEFLFQEVYRPYCGQSHPLFGETLESPQELAEFSFILTGADEPEGQTRLRQRYGLGRHIAGLSEHLEEARRLTVLGVGLCFLPTAFAERDVEDGLLHPVLGCEDAPTSDVFVIYNPEAPEHPARAILLDYFLRFRTTL